MQLFVNHFIAHSDPFSNFLINSCKSLEKAEIMQISSASPKKQIINKNFEKYWT